MAKKASLSDRLTEMKMRGKLRGKTRKKGLSQAKAKEIMRHGEVRGRSLTKKQRGLFGLIAGGKTPTKQ